jgi:hypothetical protein
MYRQRKFTYPPRINLRISIFCVIEEYRLLIVHFERTRGYVHNAYFFKLIFRHPLYNLLS